VALGLPSLLLHHELNNLCHDVLPYHSLRPTEPGLWIETCETMSQVIPPLSCSSQVCHSNGKNGETEQEAMAYCRTGWYIWIAIMDGTLQNTKEMILKVFTMINF
jgi:hypothetical protein